MAVERHVGFVRNVMLGREGLHRTVLLGLVEVAGGANARSFMTTGNVAFDASPQSIPVLVEALEAGIEAVIGRREEVYVRTLDELGALVAADPFANPPWDDAVGGEVTFMQHVVDVPPQPLGRRGDAAVVAVVGREVCCATRLVDGKTHGPGGWVERLAGHRVTTRGWRTICYILRKEGR